MFQVDWSASTTEVNKIIISNLCFVWKILLHILSPEERAVCPPLSLVFFQISAGLMKDITSVHKPDETHVIALTLHALEPFTP